MKDKVWKRLQDLKCPERKCGADLHRRSSGFACTRCNFFIGNEAFDRLVQKLYNKEVISNDDVDNLSALNNFGRERMSEDFSDSRFLDI